MSEDTLPEGLVGSANYTNRQYETFKLKAADDAFQFRPLPPMKSLIKRRDIGLFWKTHFGWKGLDEKGKERLRPFLCIEEKRDGRIVGSCAACDLRNGYRDRETALIAKKKGIEAKGLELKKTPPQIREALKPTVAELAEVKAWLYDHGLDGKFRLPCINRAGKLGLFAMPYGLLKKFRERCRELSQKGFDPCGIKGMWFEATRNGPASPQSDDCQPYRISQEDGSEKLDFHTLDNATIILANEVLPDLTELMEKGRISNEKIAALVNCSGDPEEVDRILGIEKRRDDDEFEAPASEKTPAAAVGDDAFGGVGEPDPFAPGVLIPPATQAAAPAAEPAAPEATEDDEEAALVAALAAARSKKAALAAKTQEVIHARAAEIKTETSAPPAKASKPAAAKAAPVSSVTSSDDEFEDIFNKTA